MYCLITHIKCTTKTSASGEHYDCLLPFVLGLLCIPDDKASLHLWENTVNKCINGEQVKNIVMFFPLIVAEQHSN